MALRLDARVQQLHHRVGVIVVNPLLEGGTRLAGRRLVDAPSSSAAGEIADRRVARLHPDDAPAVAILGEEAAEQLGQQPGAHQRRLAAAGAADHAEEALVMEDLEQLGELLSAAEEVEAVALEERAQADVRVRRGG